MKTKNNGHKLTGEHMVTVRKRNSNLWFKYIEGDGANQMKESLKTLPHGQEIDLVINGHRCTWRHFDNPGPGLKPANQACRDFWNYLPDGSVFTISTGSPVPAVPLSPANPVQIQDDHGTAEGQEEPCPSLGSNGAVQTYGLDLAGYSSGRSALAAATMEGDRPTVTVLSDHAFCRPVTGKQDLATTVSGETACMLRILESAHLYVDVPIDLQGLPRPEGAQFIWELTHRPVDRAFGGLPPLADRIGYCVARMQQIWSALKAADNDPLGVKLFETYPAASLKLSQSNGRGYKGGVAVRSNEAQEWRGSTSSDKTQQGKNNALARLLTELGWGAAQEFRINDDEFDAAVCALTGLSGNRLEADALAGEINKKVSGNNYRSPKGYVLLREIPRKVIIERRQWSA